MIDTNSPGLMSTVIRRSTYVWPGPTGYDFSIPRVEMIGAFAGRSVALGTADNEDVRLNSMETPYWPARAVVGFVETARRAGSAHARLATTSNTSATQLNTLGSITPTSYNCDSMDRRNTNDPLRPSS